MSQPVDPSERFREAIARFDRANAEDPNVETAAGAAHPKELLYAQRMSAALERFAPDASEVVRLAVRCQHIRRWTVRRDRYPEGRDGYRRWRTDLGRFHADTAGDILREVGYEDATVGRVKALLRKERLKADPEVQLLEDVVCLVFLGHYLTPFAARHEDEKVVGILQRDVAEDVGPGPGRRTPSRSGAGAAATGEPGGRLIGGTPNHALLQHRGSRPSGRPLPYPAARTGESERSPRSRPRQEVLRAARPAADRQDDGAARVTRLAERRRRLPLRVRQRGDRPGVARGRGGGHAHGPGRVGARGEHHARRTTRWRVSGPACWRGWGRPRRCGRPCCAGAWPIRSRWCC